MPFPSVANFGIEANPLIDSVFASSGQKGNPVPPITNLFLLLNTTPMSLLNGNNLMLLA